MIEDIRGNIEYNEVGRGPTVVFVPGSSSTSLAWRPMISKLQSTHRCVTTSLLGYGGTAERRTDIDTNIAYEAEVIEQVIRRATVPVHLVGHSFGGLSALAVALRKRVALLSLTILEAPAPEILRVMGEQLHYQTFRNMTLGYFNAFNAGETDAARRMIDFYGASGTFDAWPQHVREFVIETTPVNILDWASSYSFKITPGELATVRIRTMVAWGQHSHPAVRRTNELLAQCMGASGVEVAGAAHFMISTHPEEMSRRLSQHIMTS